MSQEVISDISLIRQSNRLETCITRMEVSNNVYEEGIFVIKVRIEKKRWGKKYMQEGNVLKGMRIEISPGCVGFGLGHRR